MDQALVLDNVPTEPVPGLFPPLTFVRIYQTHSNISLPNVDRRRTVIQDVDALSALLSSGHTLIFYVLGVACPPLTKLLDQFQGILYLTV